MRITFGKHNGTEIRDLPVDYLLWLINNNVCKSPAMQREVEAAYFAASWQRYEQPREQAQHERDRQRRQQEQNERDYQRQRDGWGKSGGTESQSAGQAFDGVIVLVPAGRLPLFGQMIESGFKTLSLKLHPDQGGSSSAMQELLELRTTLRAQLPGVR
jgi:hypothetical protein